ncbi:MAG: M56 family metallopeptidase [Paludisphaera borealis]|uniref:M56 family metallopeptidase n=1 Tax=Paludisphaera borealis TaxID=1387353 RepID=UPI00284599ED|nr:M56 family metallopeptidase [Paludisphaera borealis]MDR3618773.1 M56 family metallopeptidase [Paludisphaera borealis]
MRSAGWLDLGDAAFALFAGVMLVSTTAIVLAGLIGLALKRRASARHAAWLCALAVVLLSPALAWVGPTLALPPIALPKLASSIADRPERASATDPAKPVASPDPVGLKRGASTAVTIDGVAYDGLQPAFIAESVAFYGTTMPAASAAVEKSYHWSGIARGAIVAIWLIGALGLLVRLARGCREVVRLRRTARPFRFGAVLPRVASALRINVDRLPAIGVSDRTSQPLTLGLIRPSVLIPEGLAASLPADALRDVLIHECAHALRRGTLVGLLQRFAAILCWPNPLVHLMNRALESAREELCDNHVLRAADPADYAASLLAVAERRPFAADFDALLGLPMIARRGTLESRIAALIDPRRHAETSTRRGAVAGLAVLFLAAGAAVAAVRFGDAEQPLAVVASSKPLDPTKTRIEGVVVDESGKPAADARVSAWSWNELLLEARTGVDGRFALDVEPSPLFRVLASNADGSLQAFDRRVGGYQATERILETRLTLKPARDTTVRVADVHGAPIADATVVVVDDFTASWEYKTDAKGEARVRIASDAEVSSLVAVKPGAGLDYFEGEEFWPGRKHGPLPETVELVLDGAMTMKVQVVDAFGAPVPGVPVTFPGVWKPSKRERADLRGPAFTRNTDDREGVAVFDFIPKGQQLPPYFSAGMRGTFVVEYAEGDREQPGKTLVMRGRRNATVTGRVFSADGEPAPGVLVRAEGQGRPFGQGSHSTRTAADGSYHLAIHPEASYMIGVVDDEWAAPSRRGIVPHEGELIQGVDFHLEPGALVRGRVTTGGDEPAAGARICLIERGANVEHLTTEVHDGQTSRFGAKTETLRRWTTTDPDGGFAFRVGPGSFSLPDELTTTDHPFGFLMIADDEYRRHFRVEGRAEVVHDFKIIDRSDNKSFVVTVREAGRDGGPVPDARIAASPANVEEGWLLAPHTGRADAQGRFRARSINQTMYFFARSADGARGGFGSIDSVDAETSISIEKGTTVSGRVVSADGTPIPRALLYVYLAGPAADADAPNPANRDGVQIVMPCDAQGRYTLTGLPVGARVHVTQTPHAGMGFPQKLGSIDFVVEALTPLSAPNLVFKPSKP